MLRARKKKEKQTTNLQTWLTSDLDSGGELQISYSCNNSEGSPKAPYTVMDFLQPNKRA